MSNYVGYKPEDNARRKANNVGDELPDLGKNQNVKSYSTKPGQLSRAAQVEKEYRKYQSLNKRQPVRKIDDPNIIAELNAKYKKAA